MKLYIRLIVMGVVLILLLGNLSACGEHRDMQAEQQNENSSGEPSEWTSSLLQHYAVIKINSITDERIERQYPKDMIFRAAECQILYCNRFDERNVNQIIYCPNDWLLTTNPGDLFFATVEVADYMWIATYGGQLQVVPFVDGRLVYDGLFEGINELNRHLERAPNLTDVPSQVIDLLPSEPFKTGATIGDVIQFFEKYKEYEIASSTYRKGKCV